MMEVNFSVTQPKGEPTKNEYLGRRGYGKCNGVLLEKYTNPYCIRITPITSQGNPSQACHIEVPITELEAFILGLKQEGESK